MNEYNMLYIVNDKLDTDAIKAVIERYKAIVAPYGEPTVDEWGMRNFAYTVKSKATGEHKKGYYVLMKFTAPADVPAEIERQMRISEDVIRYLTERVG